MKKRANLKLAPPQPVVPPEILQAARQTLFEAKPRKTHKCRVCGGEGATEQSELLCWVCRRLKISAWRDIEQPAPMTE